MKKKMYRWMVAFMLCLLVVPVIGLAQEEPPQMLAEVDTPLQGLVVELMDGGFLMRDADAGQVLIHVTPDTLLSGILLKNPIAVGQYVFVQYNGIMTRSLPPQVSAQRIGCYTLQGIVQEIRENGFLLTGSAQGDVLIHTEDREPLFVGMPITVYHNGTMALSLPPQTFGWHIVRPMAKGVVESVQDEHIVLTAKGQQLVVRIDEETILPEDFAWDNAQGKHLVVYHAGMEEGKILALAIRLEAVEETIAADE